MSPTMTLMLAGLLASAPYWPHVTTKATAYLSQPVGSGCHRCRVLYLGTYARANNRSSTCQAIKPVRHSATSAGCDGVTDRSRLTCGQLAPLLQYLPLRRFVQSPVRSGLAPATCSLQCRMLAGRRPCKRRRISCVRFEKVTDCPLPSSFRPWTRPMVQG